MSQSRPLLFSVVPEPPSTPDTSREQNLQLRRQNAAMSRLIHVVQELSLARSLDAVIAIVRKAARELTGADGATFILREDDQCHYADEDAIGPLWKGQRFPMGQCISGWVMLNHQPTVIEDIYKDPRIPVDAYKPTFVKSLVMVPIRPDSPIGAIGNYWAHRHAATPLEVEVLQALANTTSVAIENVQLYACLEQRVRDRTVQLEASNHELEAFSYSVSHDLRAPLRHIDSFAHILTDDYGAQLDQNAKHCLDKIHGSIGRMSSLIDDLLRLARFSQMPIVRKTVNLSELLQTFAQRLQAGAPERKAKFQIQPGLTADGDAGLLAVVIENLLSNAWKYTSKLEHTVIEFGFDKTAGDAGAFFIRDNGAGFDMRRADKLFTPFQRLHAPADFPGSGIGLATVRRIIQRHEGRIWAEAVPDKGATFFFTLPKP